MKIKEDLIRSLMAQRLKLNNKLQSWNEKNIPNTLLEQQITSIDLRVDYLLASMGGAVD